MKLNWILTLLYTTLDIKFNVPNPLILHCRKSFHQGEPQEPHTIYAAYLVNTKFGELEHNANLQTFDLTNREILSVDCFITHMTIISVRFGNCSRNFQTAKLKSLPNVSHIAMVTRFTTGSLTHLECCINSG